MLIQEPGKRLIITYAPDCDENCPAGKIASHFIKENNLDFDSIYRFDKMEDVLTFEIENVIIDAKKNLNQKAAESYLTLKHWR